ncbi:1-deoxy-D-xylulose-5-phosphate reductoisomerase [Corynebacterium sp. sy039]|uniref:1-deoxy-D-xylulose-5-phosphate reductoisomerase n=1 Tax=Corynebacterium sp. sy039 TaxID=2599641 RepID=UPI0011B41A2E|nr:1-deoxy-D-xylulose-5-phosphate reductoisomerase [Corynebacterium sp. sy039]QDZ42819.1 1-deoxy-D-xylulose-5-phosphate reductoisomerase [Corynebacterium sp. sy039]
MHNPQSTEKYPLVSTTTAACAPDKADHADQHYPKRIIILGSTGSIGTQALSVIADNPDRFVVVGLAAAGSNPQLVIRQAQQLGLASECVAIADAQAAQQVSQALGGQVISGQACAQTLVETVTADTVLNALVGSLGLGATLATINAGATLALANKESLVAGGQLVIDAARPGQIVPVDSEHSAMAQALRSGRRNEVAKFILTASGGPFRGWTRSQMQTVTPEQAAAHPTWSMGQMNTLNSATLVNKGLELIEATLLFGISPEHIDVTVHPQSIVHSMITFRDGATIAQASPPSMKLPIALALGWPDRVPDAQPALDFSTASTWEFMPVDNEAFPAVELARHAATLGGGYPAVYNAANEQAAASFLAGGIAFPHIVEVIEFAMNKVDNSIGVALNLDDVLATELAARRIADEYIASLLS